MRPRVSIISLGVEDVRRSVAFYRDGLEFPFLTMEHADDPARAIATFAMEDGTVLNVWSFAFMQSDVGERAGGDPAITLGLAADTTDEVDRVMAQAEAAGARIVRDPIYLDWGGYSGYFADPDGHLWEPVWFPPEHGWAQGRLEPTPKSSGS